MSSRKRAGATVIGGIVVGGIVAGGTIAGGGGTAWSGHTMAMVIPPGAIITETVTIPIAAMVGAGGTVTGATMDGAATADGAITVVGDIAGGATTADGGVAIASGASFLRITS